MIEEDKTPFPPRKFWKKKYPCHKLKGEHEFELIAPTWSGWMEKFNIMTTEQIYKTLEEEHAQYGFKWPIVLYWRCRGCGHKEHEFNGEIKNRKIVKRV